MQIAVFLEPMPGHGFRARSSEPFGVTAQGATREEALAKIKEEVHERLRAGGEVVTVELEPPPHRLAKYAGMFKEDDLLVKEWEEAVKEYRRQVDEGPEIL